MPGPHGSAIPSSETVTVILRGYFSRHLPSTTRSITLPLTEAPTPRAALARLSVPAGAVGLLIVNKQQATMDTPLQPGDTLEVLPLLGGGCGRRDTHHGIANLGSRISYLGTGENRRCDYPLFAAQAFLLHVRPQ